MTFIKCPKCQNEISDRMTTCVQCGFSMCDNTKMNVEINYNKAVLQKGKEKLLYESRKEAFLISKKYEKNNSETTAFTEQKNPKNRYRLHCDDQGVLLLPKIEDLIAATKCGEAKWFIKDDTAVLPKEINTYYCFYDVAYLCLYSLYSPDLSRRFNKTVSVAGPEVLVFCDEADIFSARKEYLNYSEQKELLALANKQAVADYYHRRNKKVSSQKAWSSPSIANGWSEESILRRNGYTVAQSEGLTNRQRQHILEDVIRRKLITKEQAINHIMRQINLKSTDSNMDIAIKKWEEDILFLLNL